MNEGQPLNIVLKNIFVEFKSIFCSLSFFRFFIFLFFVYFIFSVIYLELGLEWIKGVDLILSILGVGFYATLMGVLRNFINKLDTKSLYDIFLYFSFAFIIYLEYILLDFKKTGCKLIPEITGKE